MRAIQFRDAGCFNDSILSVAGNSGLWIREVDADLEFLIEGEIFHVKYFQ